MREVGVGELVNVVLKPRLFFILLHRTVPHPTVKLTKCSRVDWDENVLQREEGATNGRGVETENAKAECFPVNGASGHRGVTSHRATPDGVAHGPQQVQPSPGAGVHWHDTVVPHTS